MELQWSKLKKRVEQFFCKELQGRVELFSTWYNNGGSPQRGRAAILVDKNEVFESNTDKWIMARDKQGLIERSEFHNALEEYLFLSLENFFLAGVVDDVVVFTLQ
jgi:hypothetical protein